MFGHYTKIYGCRLSRR